MADRFCRSQSCGPSPGTQPIPAGRVITNQASCTNSARRLVGRFRVIAIVPRAPGASRTEVLDGVEVIRYRYAPAGLETLVNDGGIVGNLRRSRWKLILVPGFILAQWWCAWRILRREKIDVIHAHWLIPQGLSALFLCKFSHRPIPYMVTSHGVDLYALKGPGPRSAQTHGSRSSRRSVCSQPGHGRGAEVAWCCHRERGSSTHGCGSARTIHSRSSEVPVGG